MVSLTAVFGTTWCQDTLRTKQFLDEHNVSYKWIDIDKDEEGENFVITTNKGNKLMPTLLFDDGSTLSIPSNEELADKLGISEN